VEEDGGSKVVEGELVRAAEGLEESLTYPIAG